MTMLKLETRALDDAEQDTVVHALRLAENSCRKLAREVGSIAKESADKYGKLADEIEAAAFVEVTR
jgi:hypothetical protein